MALSEIPHMTYQQYRTARRLVHECCNYDCGNCLLLDDGEECICPQSITYSLVCKWFRSAVPYCCPDRGVRSFYGKPFSRSTISLILRNPIYAMADLDIYEFFKSQGTEIYNDAADFVGTNGCYYYRSKGSTDNKHKYLQGQMLVLAPSDGFIPSDLWLRGRSFRDGIMTLLLLRPKLIGQITEFEKSLRIKNKVCR